MTRDGDNRARWATSSRSGPSRATGISTRRRAADWLTERHGMVATTSPTAAMSVMVGSTTTVTDRKPTITSTMPAWAPVTAAARWWASSTLSTSTIRAVSPNGRTERAGVMSQRARG